VTSPNRGGRPPLPGPEALHDAIKFRVPKPLKVKFRRHYPEGRRSEVLREVVEWLLREPGAKLPDRPPRVTEETPDSEQAA
jgi:hypothetical protein